MDWLRRLPHQITGCNGYVVSGWADDGYLMIGFRCAKCGKVSGLHRSPWSDAIDPQRVAAQRAYSKSLGDVCYWEPSHDPS